MRFKVEQFKETKTFAKPEKPWRTYFPGWPGCPHDSKNFRTRQEARDYGKVCLLKSRLNNDARAFGAMGFEGMHAAVNTGVLTGKQFEKLFSIFQTEMPYGTQKARSGDPDQWILARLQDLASRLTSTEQKTTKERRQHA